MDSNKSTALFEIPQLSAQQGGLWECRVSTNGGQDSRKFNLTVKGTGLQKETSRNYLVSTFYMYFFLPLVRAARAYDRPQTAGKKK